MLRFAGGALGKITLVRTWWHGNGYHLRKPNFTEQPAGLDWKAWLGSAKFRPFNAHQGCWCESQDGRRAWQLVKQGNFTKNFAGAQDGNADAFLRQDFNRSGLDQVGDCSYFG